MANTRDIRLRIRAVLNIQKITRAMQMVAASRLKRAQDAAFAAGPYADKMVFLARELSRGAGAVKHPLLEVRPVEKRLVVVFTSDKGLCGAYNTNVLRRLEEQLGSGPPADVFTVGKKAADYQRFRGRATVGHEPMPTTGANMGLVQRLTRQVTEWYSAREYDHVTLIYTRFKSVVSSRAIAEQLLPLQPPEEEAEAEAAGNLQFIFEPEAEILFPLLVKKYVQNQFYRGLVDAYASELGSRMVTMKNATDNADEVVSTLRLKYNRIRQAAITKEILEVVSGAEALQ